MGQLFTLEQQSLRRRIPIIGREKGAWLLQKVKELQPKIILELGTANGYSGCILGSQGAKLLTIEINHAMAEEAAINFSRYGINAKIVLGEGTTIIKELVAEKQLFDLIFIDFAKKEYLPVLEGCLLLVKTGGVIIADNISMAKCQNFKAAVLHHHKLRTEIINIGDGLSYSIKLGDGFIQK